MRQFDYSAIDTPVTLPELWIETKKHKLALYVHVAFMAIMGFFFVQLVIMGSAYAVIFLLFGGLLTIPIIFSMKQAIMLQRFIDRNGLSYIGPGYTTEMPGAIFQTGSNRRFIGGIADAARGWLLANYEYTTGSGKNKQTHNFGVIQLTLPRNMPHVLLDAKKNNFWGSNLPTSFASGQKLSLEGNFNDTFTVYVPAGYQRDALYFLTPELMAVLVDKGSAYDFEVVDNNLFIYTDKLSFSRKKFQKTIEQHMELIQLFSTEFNDNVERYADTRIENSKELNMVGTDGTRLKKSIAWSGIVIGIIFMAIYIVPWILQFFV